MRHRLVSENERTAHNIVGRSLLDGHAFLKRLGDGVQTVLHGHGGFFLGLVGRIQTTRNADLNYQLRVDIRNGETVHGKPGQTVCSALIVFRSISEDLEKIWYFFHTRLT